MGARRDPPLRSESLRRAARLSCRADFQRCYRQGLRRHGRFAILHAAPNDCGQPRLGMTVSRKVGGSVVRVRIKRRIREIFRRWSERSSLPDADLMFHVKPAAASASFEEFEAELLRLMSWLARRTATTP